MYKCIHEYTILTFVAGNSPLAMELGVPGLGVPGLGVPASPAIRMSPVWSLVTVTLAIRMSLV